MVTLADRTEAARELMLAFADRTGLISDIGPDRYLWTDAFAVCNFLALDRLDLARELVGQVHAVLGGHRPDDARQGWLSGLKGAEAERHPTAGGLRIGKPLPERRMGEPIDERLEWDRDGQYFHYLTKWMHALDRVGRRTGDDVFLAWARELADVAYRAFVRGEGRHRRLAWKMSIDLSRPLVPSMGHHDPLDGYVTCLALADGSGGDEALAEARDAFAEMIPEELATADPLGIGGLLTDAWRIDQLGRAPARAAELRDRLLEAAVNGLGRWAATDPLREPAEWRLAFRELGLAIGLAAAERLRSVPGRGSDKLRRFGLVRAEIEAFWLEPGHRQVASWQDHRNINDVMLATALVPDGYLGQ